MSLVKLSSCLGALSFSLQYIVYEIMNCIWLKFTGIVGRPALILMIYIRPKCRSSIYAKQDDTSHTTMHVHPVPKFFTARPIE